MTEDVGEWRVKMPSDSAECHGLETLKSTFTRVADLLTGTNGVV